MSARLRKATELMLQRAFVALMRMGLRDGVTVKRMAELLTAGQIQALRDTGMTQEEIMAASGYTLKTIRKVLQNPPELDTTNLLERFVGDWKSDPDFPDSLPLDGENYPTFVDLCDRYRGDFKPGGLLKHLAESGLITIAGGLVTVHGRAVTPRAVPERLQAAGSSIEALVSTLEHNLSGAAPPFLERRYWSHRMPREQIPQLREQIRELTYEFRDRLIVVMEAAENSGGDECQQEKTTAGIGVYWFEEAE